MDNKRVEELFKKYPGLTRLTLYGSEGLNARVISSWVRRESGIENCPPEDSLSTKYLFDAQFSTSVYCSTTDADTIEEAMTRIEDRIFTRQVEARALLGLKESGG